MISHFEKFKEEFDFKIFYKTMNLDRALCAIL